jgi:dipeptidyl aminopeptidase/acylaminoacyl peptidase
MDELPSDAVYDLARPMQVTVSPDGSRVAVQVFEHDRHDDSRRSSVLTVPADGSRDPHRLTRASDGATTKWSPDGSRLGVVMTRERDVALRVGSDGSQTATGGEGTGDGDSSDAGEGTGDGDSSGDEPRPQLWVYDLARGGDARQVTDFEAGIRDFDWGPAGERVVVSARDPTDEEAASLERRRDGGPVETERLQHRFDGVGWLDTVTTYLFVVDVDSRESRRLDDAHGGGILEPLQGLQPAWHPAGDRIAFLANHGERPDDSYAQAVHLVDADTGETQQLTPGERMVGEPTWSPDGSRLAVVASDPTNWYVPADVRVIDPAAGESYAVTDGLDRHLAWFEHVVWLDDDSLLTAIGDGGWSRFVRLSVTGGHERVYGHQSRGESLTGFDAGGGTVAFVRQHSREGIDVFGMPADGLDAAVTEESDPRRRLTELNPALVADYEHPDTERVAFEGADGDTVEGIAFLPPGFDPAESGGDRPLLLKIHGGPRRYDEPQFDLDTAFWTTRGYVVFRPNYHGSTSYGRAFCERLGGAWNDVEVADLLAGTDELLARGWVDPDRLFVTGFSYGGRATAYVLAESDRFAAGVAEHGSYDMRASFGTDDSHEWLENEFGLPWENPDAYDDASAITDVDDIDTPLLLTAGEDDLRTPPSQSEQLYVSLRKRGVPSKLVVYPDTHHVHYYIADPDRAVHRLETLSAWFERFDPADDRDD